MEQFFSNNPYALYFIGLLFLIISNKNNNNEEIDKNIILVYIIFALVNVFNIIEFKYNLIVMLLICFIELQIINLNSGTLVVKSLYKIEDFAFMMVNKYKIIYFLLCNLLLELYRALNFSNIIASILIEGIFFILLTHIISKIYRNEFRVNSFKQIEDIFEKKAKKFDYKNALNQNSEINFKLNMLIDIEDKTYMFRKRSHSSISLEALMCKINRQEEYDKIVSKIEGKPLLFFLSNIKITIKYAKKMITKILKAIFYKNGIKRFIKRGYSTIEMQWIRNVAISIGYEKVYRRKIFEIMYSNIFFKSLKEKRRYYTYPEYFYKNSRLIFKMLIVYVYLNTVPTFLYINNNRIKIDNIYKFYKIVNEGEIKEENIIERITKEALFIFIMGLSGKKIDENLYELYSNYIEKYNIDTKKVDNILKQISYN